MKYFKSLETGSVYAYSSLEERELYGHSDLVEMTPMEVEQHLNPPPPPPNVPKEVSRAQGKSALIQCGLWPSVLTYADSIEDDTQRALADVALNDTTHWQRSSPFLNAAATALGLTNAELDELFIQASKVEL